MSFEPTNEDAIRQSAFADGEAYAEARIIKLLEAMKNTRPTETNTTYRGYSFERIIALIKGETE